MIESADPDVSPREYEAVAKEGSLSVLADSADLALVEKADYTPSPAMAPRF